MGEPPFWLRVGRGVDVTTPRPCLPASFPGSLALDWVASGPSSVTAFHRLWNAIWEYQTSWSRARSICNSAKGFWEIAPQAERRGVILREDVTCSPLSLG